MNPCHNIKLKDNPPKNYFNALIQQMSCYNEHKIVKKVMKIYCKSIAGPRT